MKPPMLHTAYKVTTTKNAYGDYQSGSETALACHFRYITQLAEGSNNEVTSDAMAWFEADSGVAKGDIIKFEDEYYRVQQIIEARKLRKPQVQFIKVTLLKHGVIS